MSYEEVRDRLDHRQVSPEIDTERVLVHQETGLIAIIDHETKPVRVFFISPYDLEDEWS